MISRNRKPVILGPLGRMAIRITQEIVNKAEDEGWNLDVLVMVRDKSEDEVAAVGNVPEDTFEEIVRRGLQEFRAR